MLGSVVRIITEVIARCSKKSVRIFENDAGSSGVSFFFFCPGTFRRISQGICYQGFLPFRGGPVSRLPSINGWVGKAGNSGADHFQRKLPHKRSPLHIFHRAGTIHKNSFLCKRENTHRGRGRRPFIYKPSNSIAITLHQPEIIVIIVVIHQTFDE